MPAPSNPDRYPSIYFELARLCQEDDESISFEFDEKRDALMFKRNLNGFRKALEDKHRGKLGGQRKEEKADTHRLLASMNGRVIRLRELDDGKWRVSLDSREHEPLNAQIEHQLEQKLRGRRASSEEAEPGGEGETAPEQPPEEEPEEVPESLMESAVQRFRTGGSGGKK